MAVRGVRTRVAAIGVLALGLAGCSSDVTATGWIPHDGVISGVITLSDQLTLTAAPARAATAPAPASAGGRGALVLKAPRLPAALAGRALPAAAFRRSPRASRAGDAFAPHDLIVLFRPQALAMPPVGSAALAGLARGPAVGRAIRSRLAGMLPAGARLTGVSPAILAARVRIAAPAQWDAAATALRRNPAVAAVVRNHIIRLERGFRAPVAAPAATTTIPNDEFYAAQAWHYGLIDLPRAWSITQGSPSVLVGVVDDGIRFDHPAIAPNLTGDGYDFVSDGDTLTLCPGSSGTPTNADDGDGIDPDPTIPDSYSVDSTGTCFIPESLGGHGLHVAGTIGAAGNDGLGVTGVNWTVKTRPVRAIGVGGFGNDYDIAQGILYAAGLPADNGAGGTVAAPTPANIINLSLGGPDDDATLHAAITSAANAGVLIVAAAGNEGTSDPEYPAAYPEVLAVAAVGPDGAPAAYSNFGSYVALRAPGGNFDLGDATDGVASTMWVFRTSDNLNMPVGPDYAYAEGTSMAAPHVTGVAALLLAQDPSLTAAALRTRLTQYAVGPANAYGAGLLNAYNSLTQTFGPAKQTFARLYSATTGAPGQMVAAQADGGFEFTNVPDGLYDVYAGTDEDGDSLIGVPGRPWGALGGPVTATTVRIFGQGAPVDASFAIGAPTEVEPNHDTTTSNVLVVGGYVQGEIADTSLLDVYRVKIPRAGSYTFETSGWVGACGFALEEATAIGLFSPAGQFLQSAGYIAPASLNYCSRLTTNLGVGMYYVAVAGAFPGGRYRLSAQGP
jgi:serine protease